VTVKWEKLCDGLPAIVFCDIEMPRMDGLNYYRMMKDPKLSHLPIAMLTSGCRPAPTNGSTTGASGYITKPYLEEARCRPTDAKR